jgi:hypothetical protein
VAVQDTKVTVKAFQGKEDTTARDLIEYYASSCLARVSDFIPNAEVLGLNVVDSTVFLVGMAILGPIGGVAALGAVDGVKATIAAGKKSRNVDQGAVTSPLDVFRGIAYSIQESSKYQDTSGDDASGNFGAPWNLLQSVSSNTRNYVKGNEARLGGAMIVRGVFGGPIGGIAVGLASQAVASPLKAWKTTKTRNRTEEQDSS